MRSCFENNFFFYSRTQVEASREEQRKPKQKTLSSDLSTDLQNEYEKQLSDVDRSSLVDEKVEDFNVTERLRKQREEKTRL